MALKLNTESLRYIAALESTTHAEVLNCVVNEREILYVVKKGHLGMAIGREGMNVKRLKKALGKNISIVEYTDDAVKFAKNLMKRAETIKNISLQGGGSGAMHIVIEAEPMFRRSLMSKKVQILRELLKRHHGISEVIIKSSG